MCIYVLHLHRASSTKEQRFTWCNPICSSCVVCLFMCLFCTQESIEYWEHSRKQLLKSFLFCFWAMTCSSTFGSYHISVLEVDQILTRDEVLEIKSSLLIWNFVILALKVKAVEVWWRSILIIISQVFTISLYRTIYGHSYLYWVLADRKNASVCT